MRLRVLVRLALALPLCGDLAFASDDLESCIQLLEEHASPSRGITEKEQEIAERILAFGPEAIPYLLPLLKQFLGQNTFSQEGHCRRIRCRRR